MVRRLLLPAIVALAVAVCTIGLLYGRVRIEGDRELRTAEALSASGKTEQAIVHARRAAEWYAPGAPHVPAAYDKLVALARLSESRSDSSTALLAWQAVRHAALSSRWARVAYDDKLVQANAAIARIAARSPSAATIAAPPPEELRDSLAEGLARDVHPRTPWVMVLLAGFMLMAGGVGWFLRNGFDAEKLVWSRAKWGIILAAVGAASWAVGVWLA